MTAPYVIKPAKITGKPVIHYQCPACQEGLTNPLARAGSRDSCPACGTAHNVPGTEEKLAAEATQAAANAKQAAAIAASDKVRRQAEADGVAALQMAQQHAISVNTRRATESQWSGPSGGLARASVLALILAIASLMYAASMEISIQTRDVTGLERVVNLDRLNVRSNFVVLGAGMTCVSAITCVGACLVGCLGRWLKLAAVGQDK